MAAEPRADEMPGVIPTLIARVLRKGERRPQAFVLERAEAHGPRERTVRLVEPAPRPPVTSFERLVVTALAREGVMRFDALVDRVALDLYRDELRKGAWVLDIGLFGRNLFVPEVTRELEAANGILWAIEPLEGTR